MCDWRIVRGTCGSAMYEVRVVVFCRHVPHDMLLGAVEQPHGVQSREFKHVKLVQQEPIDVLYQRIVRQVWLRRAATHYCQKGKKASIGSLVDRKSTRLNSSH